LYYGAGEIIVQHNLAFDGKDSPGYVNPEKFFEKLKLLGGTTDQRLRKLSYEQILSILPEFEGVKPQLLATELAQYWRGEVKKEEAKKDREESATSYDDLIRKYDPQDPASKTYARLFALSNQQPFVVFQAGTVLVDVTATSKLLGEVLQGFKGRQFYEGRQVYLVGQWPQTNLIENPLFPGQPLRPDGTCDETGVRWDIVPLEVKVAIRVVAEALGKLKDKSFVYDISVTNVLTLEGLFLKYPGIRGLYESKKSLGQLPTLQFQFKTPVQAPLGNHVLSGKKVTL
jgi:hypothetical protein